MYHFSDFKDNMIQLCFSLPWRFVQFQKYNEMRFFNICSVLTQKKSLFEREVLLLLKKVF